MDTSEADACLRRIGAARPERPDRAALRDLHLRHLRSVPFENLSIHLGEPIMLEEKALFDKIVSARRGGFCYELNGIFAALLKALGFHVTLLAARVADGGAFGPPYDHLALRVDCGEPWLADVGFGSHSHYPLRLDLRGDQADPGGVFRLAETPEGDLDVYKNGTLQYRLDQRPRELTDFEATCWWHQTSPTSHFTRSLVCSLLTETGRITLSDRTLVTTSADGRDERLLPDGDAALLDAYRTHFGIVLEHPPAVRRSRAASAGSIASV
jgi:N-hydroxyarylamine O-acetyltransferase